MPPRSLSFIDFMLPTLVETPPEGADWIHEIKYDGYRTQLTLQGGRAQAFSRRGLDWSKRYLPAIEAAAELPAKSAIIDGEMVILDQETGASNYQAFVEALRWHPERIAFIAFDLLHLDGADLRKLPLVERRARLEQLVGARSSAIQFSQHVAGGGPEFFAAVERMGLEGMVSKRPDSRYKSGRADAWLKTKAFEESTYEVAGVLREPGRPAIAYMVTPDAERRYVGGAFITFNQQLRERLWARVKASAKPVKGIDAKPGTEWLKPGLIARVRHLKGETKLRHASLKDLIE